MPQKNARTHILLDGIYLYLGCFSLLCIRFGLESGVSVTDWNCSWDKGVYLGLFLES